MTTTQATKEKPMVPTVSRVADETLVELVYDRDTRKTGIVVSRYGGLWNIEQEMEIDGDRLVPFSPHNNLIAHNCVLLPSKPEVSGTKKDLLADVTAFIHRYVDLSPVFEQIAAHYILLTWVYDAFSELPYLRLRGDYGSGKTRGLIAIGSLCYKPFFAAGASTVSPIFHTMDTFGGTLVLDEADFRFSDATADLVKIFNNGTVKGLPVLRTVVNRHKEFNPAAFTVYGPKLIAMRGSFEDPALESRFLTEETGTCPLRRDIPLHTPENLHAEALTLRNRLLHYRLCNFFSIKLDPSLAAEDLEPRSNQISLPLLSLVDDPALRADIQDMLRRGQKGRAKERCKTLQAQVTRATLDELRTTERQSIPVQAITNRVNEIWQERMGVSLSARRVGSVLRSDLGIETRKSHGTYVVSASDKPKLEALADRFGTGISPPSAS